MLPRFRHDISWFGECAPRLSRVRGQIYRNTIRIRGLRRRREEVRAGKDAASKETGSVLPLGERSTPAVPRRAPSANGHNQGLGFGVASGARDGERVGGGLRGSDVDTAGIGRPDGIRLRFERNRFGVGDTVAKLDGLTAANLAGSGVEGLDGELLTAQLLKRGEVVFVLLVGALLSHTMFEDAVLPPAGKKNPADDKRNNGDKAPGVERGSLEKGFGRRIGLRQQCGLLLGP